MEYDLQGLKAALEEFCDTSLPRWVGDAHADLISMVGKGAIERTPIDTGRLISNWQGWVGPSTLANSIKEMPSFAPSPAQGVQQIERLSDEVRAKGIGSREIVEKSLIVNQTPYAGIQEDGNQHWAGKHFTLHSIDAAERNWGDQGGGEQ